MNPARELVVPIVCVILGVLAVTSPTAGLRLPAIEPASSSDTVICVELVAGQPLPGSELLTVGEVCVDKDVGILRVHYKTTNGWVLAETQLAVAASLDGIPRAGAGIPILGRFPYRTTHTQGVSEFTYSISFGELGVEAGAEVVVAAHASVTKGAVEEGAWAQGERFVEEGNPAMYFIYSIRKPR